MIGPIDVVPKPTFCTSTYSSPIFNKSVGFTVVIPLKDINSWLEFIDSSNVYDIFEYDKGYCTIPLRLISVFSIFFFIVSLWAFPAPVLVNVNPIPLLFVPVILNVFGESFMT